MTSLTLDIPADWWLSANQRLHWAEKARRTRSLRQLAATKARAEKVPTFDVCHITAHIGYPTNAKADPANANVVKPLIDGLVDAGVLVDDDDTHLIGPDYRRDTKTGRAGFYRVRLVIETRAAA